MNSKDKIIIILGITTVIVMGSISIYLGVSHLKKTNFVEENKTEIEVEMDTVVNDYIEEHPEDTTIQELDEETKYSYVMGEFYGSYENALKLGSENKKEFPKEQSKALYQSLIKLAERANYDKILDEIDKELVTYKFHEDYNWKIGNVYYDASLMMETLNVEESGKGNLVKTMKDPTMMLIGTLMIPEFSRRDVIKDLNSLSPVFNGVVQIFNHEEIMINEDINLEDEVISNLLSQCFSAKSVHVYEFQIEEYALKGYVVEYMNGANEVFTIQLDGKEEKNEFCPYQTIAYWIELYNKIGVN